MNPDFWKGKKVLVTGGCSFISSNLCDALADLGAHLRVIDDLSSGKRAYIEPLIKSAGLTLLEGDCRDIRLMREMCAGRDMVFHLAADHGGRGYVDTHNAACAMNFGLDSTVFRAAHERKVPKIVYASSGCVYPASATAEGREPKEEFYLGQRTWRVTPYDPDNLYGMVKLCGELTLRPWSGTGTSRP